MPTLGNVYIFLIRRIEDPEKRMEALEKGPTKRELPSSFETRLARALYQNFEMGFNRDWDDLPNWMREHWITTAPAFVMSLEEFGLRIIDKSPEGSS